MVQKTDSNMSENSIYDLVVIGGGPAGYAAAIRAGQLGRKVVCVEQERAGGTCLNWGCIPTKALLKSAELFTKLRKAGEFGFEIPEINYDFEKVMQRSRGVSDTMAKGIEFLFRKNKVEYAVGRGQVSAPGMVEVLDGPSKGKFFAAKHILIATGCTPRRLPTLPVDGKRIMTSREALVPQKQPKSVLIVGAGAIGVEFAYFYNTFGTQVTLVEMLPQVLPVEDEEISKFLMRAFDKQGIRQLVSTKVENIRVGENSVQATLVKPDGSEEIEVESLLLAIGVTGNLDGVLSPRVKLDLDRGYIKVNDRYESSVPGIYAAGDVIGPPWLAHVATFRAGQAVNGMFTEQKPRMVTNFPGCTYCYPQVASTGLTERQCREKEIPYKVGKFPFTASGKAVAR